MTEGFLSLKKYLSALAEDTIFQLDFEYLEQGVIQCYSRKPRCLRCKGNSKELNYITGLSSRY